MSLPTKLAIAGFALGLLVAFLLVLTQNGFTPPLILFLLWPTAIFGLGANGWSDGYVFHTIQTIVVFGGNGIVYGAITYFMSRLILSFAGRNRKNL